MRNIVSPLDGFGSPFGPQRGFNPRKLFALGEQGAWYDPSDLSTLYTDTAGTTPATVGSAVALMRDKSGRANHATQSVLAQRPILSRVPATGRRNLLTYTEQFDNAAWAVARSGTAAVGVKTPNFGIAPDGTQTACRVQLDVSAGSAGNQSQMFQTYTATGGMVHSAWIKTNDGSTVTIDGFTTAPSTPGTITVTGDWQRLSATSTAAGAFNFQFILIKGVTSDTADLLVWYPQAEIAATATAYQRVVTQFDVTEAGVADLHYLFCDGTDDGMVTSAIDFTATDEMTVVAGVRKLSDAAGGDLYGLSATPNATNGTFNLAAPVGAAANYFWRVRGTAEASTTVTTYTAPTTNILTGLADISADALSLRVNGAVVGSSAADMGTGNFSSNILYLFRRAGASLPFNGHFFGGVILGRTATAAEITSTERFIAQKTGVTL